LLILFNIISLTVALNKHYLRKFNKNGFLEMPYTNFSKERRSDKLITIPYPFLKSFNNINLRIIQND